MLNHMRLAKANPSTAQTNAVLIAARSGRHVVIDRIFVSSDTAMTVSLESSSGHEAAWKQYVGATGGSVIPVDGLVLSPTGEGMDYSTSGAGNVFLAVGYHYSGE